MLSPFPAKPPSAPGVTPFEFPKPALNARHSPFGFPRICPQRVPTRSATPSPVVSQRTLSVEF